MYWVQVFGGSNQAHENLLWGWKRFRGSQNRQERICGVRAKFSCPFMIPIHRTAAQAGNSKPKSTWKIPACEEIARRFEMGPTNPSLQKWIQNPRVSRRRQAITIRDYLGSDPIQKWARAIRIYPFQRMKYLSGTALPINNISYRRWPNNTRYCGYIDKPEKKRYNSMRH